MSYLTSIGLEIHVELKTKSKMFCSCPNDPEETRPNYNVCPICLGHPGTLPVINKEAVRKVIKVGLALKTRISRKSLFERKNYFYPDLPKGYQISQFSLPLCQEGFLKALGKEVRIREIHLEEDTAKLIHPKNSSYTLVDFNRAGIPLLELVTEPDLKSGKEARAFAENLQLILRYLNVSEANIEKGQMRIEANVSISKDKKLGTKVEVKNIGSLKAVEEAINYEIKRQREILESGEEILQQTRGWSEKKKMTILQREKEESLDYRYFPEPDLPPLSIEENFINTIKAQIPELPQERKERLEKEYNLPAEKARIFTVEKELGEYFEDVASELDNFAKEEKELTGKNKELITLASHYLISDLKGLLKEFSLPIEKLKITPEDFAELITIIYKGNITSKGGKIVLRKMFETGADPSHIIEEEKLLISEDKNSIQELAQKVIKENQKAVADFQNGKEGALQFLIGKAMAYSRGKIRPQSIEEAIRKILA